MENGRSKAFGPYLLHRELGRGGMGAVYLATVTDELPGFPDTVVVKLLHPELLDDAHQVRRFRHEAEIAVELDSPYVARVLDTGSVAGQLYIAFEHIGGISVRQLLLELLRRGVQLPIGDALGIVADALRGLEAIHGARDRRTGEPLGIIHRDVAPKNLMIRPSGQVCLIDLGLGRSDKRNWKTRAGAVLGTPGYIAPEMLAGEPVDARADLFAMGIVLFELITRHRYVPDGVLMKMVLATSDPQRAVPSECRDGVPRGIDEIVARALSRRPEDRPANAAEMRAAVEAVLAEHPRDGLLLAEILAGRTWVGIEREAREPSTLSDPGTAVTEIFARARIEREPTAVTVPGTAGTVPDAAIGTMSGAPAPTAVTVPMAAPTLVVRKRPARGVPVPIVLAAVAAAVMITLVVDREVRRDAGSASAPVPVATEAPRVSPRTEEHAEPELVAPPPLVKAAKKPREVVPVAEVQPPAAAAPTVESLTRRGLLLRAKHPDRAKELDELLTDLALEAASADRERATQRILALEKRLARIAEDLR